MINVMWIDNDDEGRRVSLEIHPDTTLDSLVATRKGAHWRENFSARVNLESVDEPEEHILQDGDRITVVPKKVEVA